MKIKWYKMYLDIADRLAQESHAVRLKVGAVFVSIEGVMSTGINGLPAGGSNVCETEKIEYVKVEHDHRFCMNPTTVLVTKPEVSHAEENLLGKMLRQGVSTKGGTVFITHAPCINCAKIMVVAGISNVIYRNEYKDTTGVDWLNKNNVVCLKEFDATI